MRLIKSLAAALAVTVAAIAIPAGAQAQPYWNHGYGGGYYHHHGWGGGYAAGAGIAGFAAGTIIGSQLAGGPVYAAPAPVYAAPTVVYQSAPSRSPAWYSYCSSRYRSFDPASGTFLGYDGLRHFCQ
ncbi:BA14K-like protein [Faunimonas pinastri]|uniref:Lectin-like protein BA14k n=1 Tax=Faunimonas pinastri TaxID=1855383 RepID=A0A1H9JF89_9HYPH|nr:BA14K family protein [Faunimonas pinastri]SEQ85453.1 BA14K-like protein [Faunimonas pinastri]